MDLKIPPYSEEAEVSVVGAMLLSKDAINVVTESLKTDDFYIEPHRMIYEAILALDTRNEPSDMVTVSEELKRQGNLEAAGGIEYLANVTSSVAAVSNTKYYCEIIKEKSTLRSLIDAADKILAMGYSKEATAIQVMESAEDSIFRINEASNKKGLVHLKEVLVESFKEMEKRANNPNSLTGVTTGFLDLDRKLSGLQKSDLVLLAARPSMGKTALMVNIATNAAEKAKAKVAVFSLEMSKHQLTQRIISSYTHIDLSKIISGKLNDDEWTRVISAMPTISALDIEIDDTPGITPVELKAKCRRLKMERGLDLVVIDYLQLMEVGGNNESRQQEISKISRGLKALAKDLEVPVVALSQLSRAPEMRADHRPILSDLRESGAIEQDADVVMFLYRDEYYNKEQSEEPNVGEVIIAKHRNGPTGTVKLVFRGEYTKFFDMERGK